MTTRKRNPNPVYAVASAKHEYGYGHVTIHIHELFGGRSGTLKIDCQSGGTSPGETYGWKHGLCAHDVLGVEALRNGYWLMRRVKKILDKQYHEQGAPANYAEYALRVLRAAGIRKVYIRPGLNSTYRGEEKDLPCFDPTKQGDALLEELRSMEQAIISRS